MNGVIRLWDTRTKKEIHENEGGIRSIGTLAFSPDGDRVFAGISRVWDVKTGRLTRAAKDNFFGGHIVSLSWKYDKVNGYFRIDPATGEKGKDLNVPAETGPSYGWAVAPDGHWYGLRADLDEPRIWDAETGKELTLEAAQAMSANWKAPFTVDGKTLISYFGAKLIAFDVTTCKRAFVWDYEAKGLVRLANQEESVYQATASPNGKFIAILIQTHGNGRQGIDPDWCWNRILLCEVPTGKIAQTIRLQDGLPLALKFSPDSKLFAAGTAGQDYPVCIWDVKTGEKLKSLAGHRGPVQSLAFRLDGLRLASGSTDSTVLIWDLTRK